MHQLITKNVLYKPKASYLLGGGNGRTSKTTGTNHAGGVAVYYNVSDFSKKDTVLISFYDKYNECFKLLM